MSFDIEIKSKTETRGGLKFRSTGQQATRELRAEDRSVYAKRVQQNKGSRANVAARAKPSEAF